MRIAALLFTLVAAGAAVQDIPPQGKTEGMPTAPVTLEVYSDFQCPACKVLHDQTLNALRYDFVSKGKVFLVFREFPLPMHQYGKPASNLACAAARLGKYYEVSNALFAKVAQWSADGKVEDAACSVLTPAMAQKLRALAKSPMVEADIQRDIQLGRAVGVDSTPTLVVTHKGKRYPLPRSSNYNLLRGLLNDIVAR